MTDYSRYKFIRVEKNNRVALLTLDRPETLNAIGTDEHLELGTIFLDIDDDKEVNAVAQKDVDVILQCIKEVGIKPDKTILQGMFTKTDSYGNLKDFPAVIQIIFNRPQSLGIDTARIQRSIEEMNRRFKKEQEMFKELDTISKAAQGSYRVMQDIKIQEQQMKAQVEQINKQNRDFRKMQERIDRAQKQIERNIFKKK